MQTDMTSQDLVDWVKSKVDDNSHSCDAVWRLLVALDDVSMGVVGGLMDTDGQAKVAAFLADRDAMIMASREVYEGRMGMHRHTWNQ
tara:strand:+ start:428 stop:688 length:261 start_codon:yes stop_codon:yes gene_type:complete